VNKYVYLKNLEPFERDLKAKRTVIERQLKEVLPGENTYPPLIHQAMRYAVLEGGKRIRPILTLMTGELFNEKGGAVLSAACAVEIMHAYSLVHDDLPAMDNDDTRRGQATVHKAFGEAIAILVGDALNTLAFNVIAEGAPDGERCSRLVKMLARCAGSLGMVGGQSIDILSEGREPNEQTLEYIHMHKTGQLMRAACAMGAIAAGADDQQVKLLGDYGANLGMAFQIIDDVLDAERIWDQGSSSRSRKRKGQATKEVEKMTYAALYGPEKSREIALQYSKKAITSLVPFQKTASKLVFMAHYLLNREP